MTFRPHPHNIDGASVPSEEILKGFGFLDVNSAIAGAMTAIANQARGSKNPTITLAAINQIVKEKTEEMRREIKVDVETLWTEVTADAHTYTNIITYDLMESLDARFAAIVDVVESTRKALKEGTPPPQGIPNTGKLVPYQTYVISKPAGIALDYNITYELRTL